MLYTVGSVVNFTICITENGIPKSNLSVVCSIQRRRDDLFFDGVNWQTGESWLDTTEERDGIYIYTFDQAQYDNSIEEEYLVTFKCEDEGYEFKNCEIYVFIDFSKQTTVNDVKVKTDNLPDDPASTTDVNTAKLDIISEIQLNRDLINELLDVEEGNWSIQNNQMIFYKRDGTELMRFNLFDNNNQPTETSVYKRERT